MERLPTSLLSEINTILHMKADALIARYSRFLGANPSRTAANLREEIIYRLQEEHYNAHISDEAAEVLTGSIGKRVVKREEREAHAPGTQYPRLWKGEQHILIYKGPKQYEYRGQIYRSPSVVAKMITGTNWNGREFFHLPPLKDVR